MSLPIIKLLITLESYLYSLKNLASKGANHWNLFKLSKGFTALVLFLLHSSPFLLDVLRAVGAPNPIPHIQKNGRSLNLISTRRADYTHQFNTCPTPPFLRHCTAGTAGIERPESRCKQLGLCIFDVDFLARFNVVRASDFRLALSKEIVVKMWYCRY